MLSKIYYILFWSVFIKFFSEPSKPMYYVFIKIFFMATLSAKVSMISDTEFWILKTVIYFWKFYSSLFRIV
jgi:hypothetical protein